MSDNVFLSSLPREALARQPIDPIDINKEASVSYWSAALGCTEFDLRVAVAEVGPAASDVGNELGKPL